MWPAITQARPAPQLYLQRLGLLQWPPRIWGPREGWATFIFLLLAHLAVVWSVERAQYVTHVPNLTFITIFALFTGLALAKLAAPDVLLFPLGVLVGLPIALWQTALTIPDAGGLWQQASAVLQRSNAWWDLALRGGISGDTLPFALLLSTLTWLICITSAWSVFRYRHPWLALLPSGLGLLVNLSYLPTSFYSYLALYLIFSMIFLARLHMAERQIRWQAQGLDPLPAPANSIIIDGVWLTAALLLVAWLLPQPRPSAAAAQWWLQLTKPWQEAEQEFNRVFASLRSHRSVPLHSYGNTLALRGSVVLGKQPILRLTASDYGTYRVRAAMYDVYTGQGWMANQRREVEPEIVATTATPDPGQRIVTATMELLESTSVLFSVGEPVQVNLPVRTEIAPGRVYLGYSQGGSTVAFQQNEDAFADLRPGEIRSVRNSYIYNPSNPQSSTAVTLSEGEQALRQALSERTPPASFSAYTTLPFYRPSLQEVAAFRASSALSAGDVYTITSFVSNPAAEDLRKATTVYPAWTDYYKRLPQELPQPVRELARQLTEGFDNPYDRALAIQEYLRRIEYSFEIDPVPANTDGVSYFLFQQRKGYCDYYASAMAVMLRAIGVPARVVVGYVLTTPDTENPNGFVVTGEDAHSWPEAYFPGYGWVEFEPTPARTLTPRPDETLGLPGGIGGADGAGEDSEEGGLSADDVPITLPAAESREIWFLNPQTLLIITGTVGGLFVLFWVFWWRTLLGLPYPAQVFEQMVRMGSWLRVPAFAHQTPSEYAGRLKRVLPTAGDDVDQVTSTYNAMRFGRRRLDENAQGTLAETWRRLRRRLLLKFIRWKDS